MNEHTDAANQPDIVPISNACSWAAAKANLAVESQHLPRRVLWMVVLATIISACVDPVQPMDTGTDAARDANVADVVDGGGNCNGVVIEDLDMLGTRSGNITRYVTDNLSTTQNAGRGIQPQSGLSSCRGQLIHERIFVYRVRTAGTVEISTNNPGTPLTFDTVVAVASRVCARTTTLCNDDDLPRSTEIVWSSRIATGGNVPGDVLLIAVGGFADVSMGASAQGPFELTVTEKPPKSDGEACELGSECAPMSSCFGVAQGVLAPGSLTRVCRRLDFTQIDQHLYMNCPATGCPTGTACLDGWCRIVNIAQGQRCDGVVFNCGANLTCVYDIAEPGNERCAPVGSVGAACLNDGTCDTGNVCATTVTSGGRRCRPLRMSGSACNVLIDTCSAGESCVTDGYDPCVDTACPPPASNVAFTGNCQPFGTRNAPCIGGQCLDASLVCVPSRDRRGRCMLPIAAGEPCTVGTTCVGGTCIRGWAESQSRCVLDGTAGGSCDGTVCPTGLLCEGTLCARTVRTGEVCNLQNACAIGDNCITDRTDPTQGHCVAIGDAGGDCRLTSPRCNTGLVCESARSYFATCKQPVAETCHPSRSTDQCPEGKRCLGTSFAEGTCAVPVVETEPNDAARTAQPVTLPLVIDGVAFADDDCYAFDLPQGGSLYAQVILPLVRACNATSPWTLDLWSADQGRVAPLGNAHGGSTISGCPRMDGLNGTASRNPFAANLVPGRYAVCVHPSNAATTSHDGTQYAVSIAARTP